MKVISPEYPQDRNVMSAHSMLIRPQGMRSSADGAREPRTADGAANSSRQTYIAPAMISPGTATATVPGRSNRVTSQAAITGPMANPRFPPAEKRDIPSPRLLPEASATDMDATGWKAAVPTPVRTITSSRVR